MHSPTPDITPTQLIRYNLTIDDLTDNDSIGRARQVLTGLGLLVDRIESGQAEVAAASGNNPGPENIKKALTEAGFTVQDITAEGS